MVGLALYCGQLEVLDQYIQFIHDNPEAASINLGYHLVYYGDQSQELGYYEPAIKDEERTITEQVERLPQEIATNILSFFDDYEERRSPEGILAHDADLLECIVQAREYQVQGYPNTQDWITNCYAGLQTDVAKNLAEACLHVEPKEWWQGLKIQ
ncbi:hypothetical protein KSZ_19720 [Dictyobacter formicarum]|uniref:HD domain-containing protein n=2 Tax=Dictyobacter formicarum TaxID=2778368 RepID=A0ABQ3VEP2_9CHLR|nr:hypothetical protein KSZ_19720 [Dictyobacter formicarum]